MDGNDLRNTQDFEEMEVVEFSWLLTDPCLRRQSLKKASKLLAIYGIAMGIFLVSCGLIRVVVGDAGYFLNFLIAYSASSNQSAALARVLGAANYTVYLLEGVLILIYNIYLLRTVQKNRAVEVFKAIKVGCYILPCLEIVEQLLYLGQTFVFYDPDGSEKSDVLQLLADLGKFVPIVQVTEYLIFLLLNFLVLYAIQKVKPKIVTIYIYSKLFIIINYGVFILIRIPLGFVASGIFQILILVLLMPYRLDLFALHRNTMNILPSN